MTIKSWRALAHLTFPVHISFSFLSWFIFVSLPANLKDLLIKHQTDNQNAQINQWVEFQKLTFVIGQLIHHASSFMSSSHVLVLLINTVHDCVFKVQWYLVICVCVCVFQQILAIQHLPTSKLSSLYQKHTMVFSPNNTGTCYPNSLYM